MKIYTFVYCAFALLVLSACNPSIPQANSANTLVLTLNLNRTEAHSVDDIQADVTLSNQGDSDILVHKRLYWLAFPVPPPVIELLILIKNSAGNLVVYENQYPNIQHPGDDTLGMLKTGEQVERVISISGKYPIKIGEEYTIFAIYQNGLDVTLTIEGIDVPSWVGSIESNKETFTILP
jgi:hypothetical protein